MTPPSQDGPVDFFAELVSDHRRIEARLLALEQAVRAPNGPQHDAALLETVAATLAFFATEGARHEEREERELLPRLRSLAGFEQIVAATQFQHRMNTDAAREVAACAERFVPGHGRELRRLALRWVEFQRCHAVAEERALFPLAAERLPAATLAEIAREASGDPRAARPSRGDG